MFAMVEARERDYAIGNHNQRSQQDEELLPIGHQARKTLPHRDDASGAIRLLIAIDYRARNTRTACSSAHSYKSISTHRLRLMLIPRSAVELKAGASTRIRE
jgi:hypothetical protein